MDFRTIIQALYYLSLKLNKDIDKLTAIKLIFFADRYHLRKYCRLITNDEYYAMKLGPVASAVKDLISDDIEDFLNDNEISYFKNYIRMTGQYNYTYSKDNLPLDMLSETEKEALDFSVQNFGNFNSKELIEFTHRYPEWKKFEQILKNGFKREKMSLLDFFKNPDDKLKDPFKSVPYDIVLSSKDVFEGMNGSAC